MSQKLKMDKTQITTNNNKHPPSAKDAHTGTPTQALPAEGLVSNFIGEFIGVFIGMPSVCHLCEILS